MTIKIPLLSGKIKKIRKKLGIRIKAKYRKVLLAKNYLILKKALADKKRVVMVVYSQHLVRVYYLDRPYKEIYCNLKAAAQMLQGCLFYKSSCNSIVNLYHFLHFEKDDKGTLMLFKEEFKVRMGKKQEKNIEQLKTFMQSSQYLNAIKKCFK